MKLLKQIPIVVLISIVMMSFSQCANTYKLEDTSSIYFGDVYYKEWLSEARWSGSGINLFIPIKTNSKHVVLDSVYFKKKQAKLEYVNDTLVVGRFETEKNKQQDIIMSNEPYAEYGNHAPKMPEKTIFQIKENECVVSYNEGKRVMYYKISGIVKKQDKQQLIPATKHQ